MLAKAESQLWHHIQLHILASSFAHFQVLEQMQLIDVGHLQVDLWIALEHRLLEYFALLAQGRFDVLACHGIERPYLQLKDSSVDHFPLSFQNTLENGVN